MQSSKEDVPLGRVEEHLHPVEKQHRNCPIILSGLQAWQFASEPIAANCSLLAGPCQPADLLQHSFMVQAISLPGWHYSGLWSTR